MVSPTVRPSFIDWGVFEFEARAMSKLKGTVQYRATVEKKRLFLVFFLRPSICILFFRSRFFLRC